MNSTMPKPFVFVLMPFSDNFTDVYEFGIKQACSEAGTYCERVDEQIFHESILEHIYNQISKADIIVADMSGRNPNVFYEVGYAHAIGKKVILLTNNADDIPFDLKHYPHIVYSDGIKNLKANLQNRLEKSIQNVSTIEEKLEMDLEFYINGNVLKCNETNDIDATWVNTDDYGTLKTKKSLQFLIDIKNKGYKVVGLSNFNFSLITEHSFCFIERKLSQKTIKQKNNRCINLLKPNIDILPDSWESIEFRLGAFQQYKNQQLFEDWILRINTKFNTIEFPLRVNVNSFGMIF